MKVVIFGASGMVGQGALRECVLARDVESVIVVGRTALGGSIDPKVTEIVHKDFDDFTAIAPKLAGTDACLFCLGVSSAGMSEAAYTRITYDTTIAAAKTLLSVSPASIFIYVSGAGTDAKARGMWARVKGKTENALLALPFKAAYMFRPAGIQPLHGIKSKTRSYRIFYYALWPVLPLLRVVLPSAMTTTERMGLAMLNLVRSGAPSSVVSTREINRLARATPQLT
jgi:uncharacterized protein YbjT (DUF2867 family)